MSKPFGKVSSRIDIDNFNKHIKTHIANIPFVEELKKMGGQPLVILRDGGDPIYPKTINHHRFSIPVNVAPRDEITTFRLMMYYLTMYLNPVPWNYCEGGKGEIVKSGLMVIKNKYNTHIRIWTSKKVVGRVVYDMSVATYDE